MYCVAPNSSRMFRGLMGDSLDYEAMKEASWLGAVLWILFSRNFFL